MSEEIDLIRQELADEGFCYALVAQETASDIRYKILERIGMVEDGIFKLKGKSKSRMDHEDAVLTFVHAFKDAPCMAFCSETRPRVCVTCFAEKYVSQRRLG